MKDNDWIAELVILIVVIVMAIMVGIMIILMIQDTATIFERKETENEQVHV